MAIYPLYTLEKREKHSVIDQLSYKVPPGPSATSPRNCVSKSNLNNWEFTELTFRLCILSTISNARKVCRLLSDPWNVNDRTLLAVCTVCTSRMVGALAALTIVSRFPKRSYTVIEPSLPSYDSDISMKY